MFERIKRGRRASEPADHEAPVNGICGGNAQEEIAKLQNLIYEEESI